MILLPDWRPDPLGKFYFLLAPEKTPVKTPEQVLMQLAANPKLTLAEVADAIGKSLSAVERASAKLVKEGRLRYAGPRKGGTWEIIDT